ncbi:MAG: hypothetical protein KBA26_09535 [Candidatus Delongbacteria bacterium]|nr:hypothetical protein [Candidatus Delongbacteria bacterium]
MSHQPGIDNATITEDQTKSDTNATKSPLGLIISFGVCLLLAVLYAIFKG